MTGYVAKAETENEAPAARVWRALTDPDEIERYMFGSPSRDRLEAGQPDLWRGTYEGKAYEDKGEVVTVEPERRLEVTHFSPRGQEDVPANYHTVVYELEQRDGTTRRRVEPGQQVERGGGRALEGQLGEDARRPEGGRRALTPQTDGGASPYTRRLTCQR